MTTCPRCGARLEKEWDFCPKCGNSQENDLATLPLMRELKDIDKEMARVSKMLEKNFEMFDISSFFRKPKKTGFTIKISTATGRQPRISVRTFGNMDKEKVEKQLAQQLGKGPIHFTVRPARPQHQETKRPIPIPTHAQAPKTTEEPKSTVKKVGNKVIVEVEIPRAKSLGDIEINELESSVEVKYISSDKAYFKIITKPPNSRLLSKKLENGILYLDFY